MCVIFNKKITVILACVGITISCVGIYMFGKNVHKSNNTYIGYEHKWTKEEKCTLQHNAEIVSKLQSIPYTQLLNTDNDIVKLLLQSYPVEELYVFNNVEDSVSFLSDSENICIGKITNMITVQKAKLDVLVNSTISYEGCRVSEYPFLNKKLSPREKELGLKSILTSIKGYYNPFTYTFVKFEH